MTKREGSCNHAQALQLLALCEPKLSMNPAFRRTAVLLSLIALDICSKVAAYAFLPRGQTGNAADLFHFELAVNPTGLGTGAGRMLAMAQGQNPLLFAAVFASSLAVCLFALKRFDRLTFWKAVLSGLVMIGILTVVSGLRLFPSVAPVASVKLLRLSQAILWCELWLLAASTPWSAGTTLLAATAAGNFLSFLYPPYAIVDFMWSSALQRMVGMNIFNCADFMWLCGLICLAFAFVLSASRRVRQLM
jgi:lipoprotein signal peptidase